MAGDGGEPREGRRGDPVVVGRLTRPHGVAGALILRTETDHPEDVFVAGRVLRVRDPRPRLPDTLTVREAQAHGRHWLLRVEELEDRTAAEQYVGRFVTVPRGELRELLENEYFLHDLVGLDVTTEDGRRVGEVIRVYEPPGAPILGVRVEGRERLIPFHREVVRGVDLPEGRMTVQLPEGLLDI